MPQNVTPPEWCEQNVCTTLWKRQACNALIAHWPKEGLVASQPIGISRPNLFPLALRPPPSVLTSCRDFFFWRSLVDFPRLVQQTKNRDNVPEQLLSNFVSETQNKHVQNAFTPLTPIGISRPNLFPLALRPPPSLQVVIVFWRFLDDFSQASPTDQEPGERPGAPTSLKLCFWGSYGNRENVCCCKPDFSFCKG